MGDWKKISVMLGDGNVSVADKISAFLDALTWKGWAASTYAKMLCWLCYRIISGRQIDKDLIISKINEHLPVVALLPRRDRQIWSQSLHMAKCYMALNDGNMADAVEQAKLSLASYDSEVNPGGIVNAMRATIIIDPLNSENAENLHRLFSRAVLTFHPNSEPWLLECITKSSRCLEINAWLGRSTERALNIEVDEPFKSLLPRVVGDDWRLLEDKRYSALYEKGYGPANPKGIAKIAGCSGSEKVIDLGCGEATLSDLFKNYTGVDISSFVIEKNRKSKAGTFIHANLDQVWKFSDEHYDVAICSDVMEHIPPSKVRHTIQSLSTIPADRFLFGICCRKSVTLGPDGENLHPTVMPPSWWKSELSKVFQVTTLEERPTWALFDCVKPSSLGIFKPPCPADAQKNQGPLT